MRPHARALFLLSLSALSTAILAAPPPAPEAITTGYILVAWNDLGMHCTDGSDFSVSTILPPYNNIHAQLKNRSGALVTNPTGITVTYQAVADPAASINTTSVGKTNFWNYVGILFGATPAPDVGLAGKAMPGSINVPQAMDWDPSHAWFHAEGVPIVPYDDAGHKNYYPMMRIVAKNNTGTVLAQTDIVLPVSDEMDCRTCHQSGSGPGAKPPSGWVYDANQARDVKFNVLRLHDARQMSNPAFTAALATAGFSPNGLEATVRGGKALLCQRCHTTNALPGSGIAGISPMTQAMHAFHAHVVDPTNGQTLDASTNRSACYRCHPGSATKCLRGAMGDAVAADGSMLIQCQGCHAGMSAVGATGRQGWLDVPNCQSCHSGTATLNAGFIRYTDSFASPGVPRQPADPTFATNPNTPSTGLSMYRFSSGHGGLQCEACHGPTHAEYPSSHVNDNVQNVAIQGYAGMLADCTSCHVTNPATDFGGPHGMHPIGQSWVTDHQGAANELGTETCQPCHGLDFTGTELSRTLGPRTLSTAYGTKTWWRGYQVGCYSCHSGSNNYSQNPNRAPVVNNTSATTTGGASVSIPLTASDADGNALALRVVNQPAHGRAALSNPTATYFPDAGYLGPDSFTVTAWDGHMNSALATVSLAVNGPGCTLSATATVPATAQAGAEVAFSATATPSNCALAPSFDWNFGDGTAHAFAATPTHSYATGGTFAWSLTVSSGTSTTQQLGSITVGAGSTPKPVPASLTPMRLTTANGGTTLGIVWDATNCTSPGYHAIWGGGSGLSSWAVAGGQCGLGTSGSASLTGTPSPTADPSRFYWFLIVADNASTTEGSWGTTSAGAERGGTSASGVCSFTSKVTSGTCATP